jgi:HAE1 family hydrophobic/amphiphilic exporter-1
MKLPEISVRRPVTMLMVFCAAILVGIVCVSQMPIDLFPKMDLPTISVITQYKGAAPEDVESKVTKVLESNLSTVPELKHITSTSKEELSLITLTFEWGSDLDTRVNEVRDMVGLSKARLPDDVDEPRVVKFNIGMFPILVYGVMAGESYPKLEKLLKDEVGDPIKRLSGVAASNVMVPLIRQINVDLDRERLAAHNLTPLDVARVIGRENANTPAGNVRTGLADYVVRVPGEFAEVEPMKSIVLSARGGSIVRLSDVGEVSDGFQEISQHIRINGRNAGIITVQKQSGANTVEVARAVRAALPKFMKRLPADVKIVPIMDSSEDI